jgi:TPR repeat protein
MPLRLIGAFVILVSAIFSATGAATQVQTITATHTYVMGDRDSKEEARALCYMTAKRKVLEQAGVLIESSSEVRNFDLTKDQISSYSGAILSVEVVKEAFEFHNGTNSLTLTVKADVDFEEVRKRLVAILADKGLQAKVDGQGRKIRLLEEKVLVLNEKLGGASTNVQDEVRKDRNAELVSYYRLGAERGEAESQFYLGLAYAQGEGVPQDFTQAVTWWRKAAEQGLTSAQFNLGQAYDKGDGVPQDLTKAVAWWRKAAEQGIGEAQYALGTHYVASKEFNEAAVWIRKAAEQGLAKAQLVLGALYDSGKGMPKDDTQAAAWYRKAAEQGFARAQFSLGLQYVVGKGVPKDYVQAYKWWNLAAGQGYQEAIMNRKMLEGDSRMSNDQLAEAQRLSREWQDAFEKRQAKQ